MADVWIELDEETYRNAEELARIWNCKTVEEAIIRALLEFYKELKENGKIQGDSHE